MNLTTKATLDLHNESHLHKHVADNEASKFIAAAQQGLILCPIHTGTWIQKKEQNMLVFTKTVTRTCPDCHKDDHIKDQAAAEAVTKKVSVVKSGPIRIDDDDDIKTAVVAPKSVAKKEAVTSKLEATVAPISKNEVVVPVPKNEVVVPLPKNEVVVPVPKNEVVAPVSKKGTKYKNMLTFPLDSSDYYTKVCITPDGNTIVATAEQKIYIWSVEGEVILKSSPLSSFEYFRCISISNDGRTIAAGTRCHYDTRDRHVLLFSIDGTLIKRWITGKQDNNSICFTTNGDVITCNWNINIWSTEGILLRSITGHTGVIYAVCISNDCNTIVSGSSENTIKIWNKFGVLRTTLLGHTNAVSSLCISNDGNTIVSGSSGETHQIKIWSTEGTLLKTLKICGYRSLCISIDNNTIISDNDNTIEIWPIRGSMRSIFGKSSQTLTGHTKSVYSVSISNDGNTIVSGSADNTIKTWQR